MTEKSTALLKIIERLKHEERRSRRRGREGVREKHEPWWGMVGWVLAVVFCRKGCRFSVGEWCLRLSSVFGSWKGKSGKCLFEFEQREENKWENG